MRLRIELGISLSLLSVHVLKKEKQFVRGVEEMSASPTKTKEFEEMKKYQVLNAFFSQSKTFALYYY